MRTVSRIVDVADLGKLRQGVNWATPYRHSTGITGKPAGKTGKNSEKEECPIFSPCGEYPQRDTISPDPKKQSRYLRFWTPYDRSYRHFDLQPAIILGVSCRFTVQAALWRGLMLIRGYFTAE